MKICFLTPSLGLHGGTLVMFRYAEHLAKAGHEVTVIGPEEPVEFGRCEGIEFECHKPMPARLAFYSCKLAYLLRVAQRLKAGFDVVIVTHTPLSIHAVYARWRYALKYRTILLYQDFFAMPWVGRYIKFVLGRKWLINRLDQVVAVSEGSAKEFWSVSKMLPTVIPNGIDDVFFSPSSSKKQDYVLFVGRPSKSKGFDVFTKAMALVTQSLPDIKGVLVSSGVEDGMQGIIQTVRFRDKQQLKMLYAEALVYVHAALGESFGLPPIEAMASGTATVITDTVGTRDYARPERNCLSVPYGDYQQMACDIVRLITDTSLRRRLEEEGRVTAAGYKWARSVERFEQLAGAGDGDGNAKAREGDRRCRTA